MRNLIYASFLVACVSTAALAQTAEQQRPVTAAPASTAPVDERDDWCRKFAVWYAEQTATPTARASDVRPTHLIETEINYCKLDPQEYERQVTAEIATAETRS